MAGRKHRRWVFTYNNYPDNARAIIETILAPECLYVCYQPERGASGTPHLQGAFCLRSTQGRTLQGIKTRLFRADGVHLEPKSPNSTTEQWLAYCSKAETRDGSVDFGFTEFGNREELPGDGGQGTRTDIDAACRRLSQGESMREVAESDPSSFVKYHKGFLAFQSVQFEPRMGLDGRTFNPPRVFWFWGPAGSGKTRAAFEASGDEAIYWKPPDNKWWDGYTQQPVVILDDYRGSWWSVSYLLRLLDGYNLIVEQKGTTIQFNSPTIYITCPNPPSVVYGTLKEQDEGKFQQIVRRLTQVREFVSDVPAPNAPPFAPLFEAPLAGI